MKTLRNILALFLFTAAISSCDSTVTIDDPKSETIEEINAKTGDQGNEEDDRGDP